VGDCSGLLYICVFGVSADKQRYVKLRSGQREARGGPGLSIAAKKAPARTVAGLRESLQKITR
jgi:hypothetical protein